MKLLAGLRTLPLSTRLKVAATALVGVPAVMLIAIALGEMADGEVTGVQHLPEGGLLLLLAAAGWRYPRQAGALLLLAGVAVLAVWLVWVVSSEDVAGRAPLLGWVAVGLVLFAPPILAGLLLLRSSGVRGGSFLPR